jgi:hypothetical protein
MPRKLKRLVLATAISVSLVIGPITIAVISAIIFRALGEGPVTGIIFLGLLLSGAFGVIVGITWGTYGSANRFPKSYSSWLLDWVNEPEPIESKPREGAWKEE